MPRIVSTSCGLFGSRWVIVRTLPLPCANPPLLLQLVAKNNMVHVKNAFTDLHLRAIVSYTEFQLGDLDLSDLSSDFSRRTSSQAPQKSLSTWTS